MERTTFINNSLFRLPWLLPNPIQKGLLLCQNKRMRVYIYNGEKRGKDDSGLMASVWQTPNLFFFLISCEFFSYRIECKRREVFQQIRPRLTRDYFLFKMYFHVAK